MYKDFTQSIPGLQIAARQWQSKASQPGALPVVALHGWLDNLESFSPLINEGTLLSAGWTITAMDFPGHGNSSAKAAGENYHFIDEVSEVLAFCEQMGWQQFIIMGHSMGAAIGSLIAAAFPQRVAAFVSIEALGPIFDERITAVKQLRKHVLRRLKKPGELTLYASIEAAIEARAEIGELDHQMIRPLVERNLEKVDTGYRWKTDRRLRWPSALRMTESQIDCFLQNINCPTLYLEGDKGYQAIHRLVKKRLPLLVDVQTVYLEGSHHLHMESVKEVAQAIDRFLKPFKG